jgi:uncharacterized protein YjbI with pentapeptide repeats
MVTVVRGTFNLVPGEVARVPEGHPLLVQGAMTSDVFRPGDEDRAGECLYPDDFADFKPRADLLLRGTCHVPDGKPLPECPVRFTVGSWSRILRVIGPRVWKESLLGATPSEPAPFTRMPLDWAHAFGGPGFPANPAGKGVDTAELPSVEQPGDILRSRRDRPAPAGFGPISPLWPARSGKRGQEYGKRWRETRAPWYAEDFDWSFFNAAPPEQQLPGYLRGDEELVFQNLHPRVQVFAARLPALRIRVFVKDREARLREVAMNLDTLFADLDRETVTLTWRGLDPVAEDDLADVQTALIASEKLGDPPLAEDHYRALVEAFEKDPLGVEDHIAEPQRAMARAILYDKAWQPGARPVEPAPDPLSAVLEQKLGGLAAPEQQRIRQAMARLKGVPLPPGTDLDAAFAAAIAARGAGAAAGFAPPASGRFPVRDARIGGLFRSLRDTVEKLKRDAEAKGQKIQGLEAYEALRDDPRIQALEAAGTPRTPPVEPGPGQDLSGQDLSDRDLAGRDLHGADFTEAILARASLRGANLAGARLERAVLAEADLTGADLTGADLTEAHLGRVRAGGAVFRGAKLDRARFEDAELAEAILEDAQGEMPMFSRADLTEARAGGVRLTKAICRDTRLERADLSRAHLIQCQILDAAAEGLNLEGATLTGTSFAGSRLSRARIVDARGADSIWTGAELDGADFGFAVLPRAHFFEARAAGARFHGTNLEGARFYRASLEKAEMVQTNLAGADFTKASLAGARFIGSNLYMTNFGGAPVTGCDFTEATLTRSSLVR